jgi:Flp pilus assembly protein protease CpaA
MYEVIVLLVLGLIWILFASIQDLKSREVANWINFSLIIFALGFRFFYSLFSGNFLFLYQGFIGLAIFFLIGNILYYSRLFAGGDAKLMIALGAILPFSQTFSTNLKIYALFMFLFLFAGSIYGFVITLYLSLKNFRAFKVEFKSRIKSGKKIVLWIMFFGIVLMILGFLESLLFVLGIITFLFPYVYFYAKAVDNVCMVREVKTSLLTEGDWLYKTVRIGKALVRPSWEGLSKEEINLIKKKYKSVKIKQGIAFVPVFLISFLVLIILWFTGLWSSFW